MIGKLLDFMHGLCVKSQGQETKKIYLYDSLTNPITVGSFAFLLNYMPVGRTSDSIMVLT